MIITDPGLAANTIFCFLSIPVHFGNQTVWILMRQEYYWQANSFLVDIFSHVTHYWRKKN